jgi:hypothetical protein
VPTDIIDVGGLDQSANYQVGLNFKDGTIRSSITGAIWVEIRIGPRRKMYVVKDVPLVIGNDAYVASPKEIDIRVIAPENLQPALVPDNFNARIPTRLIEEGALPVTAEPEISFQESWVGIVKLRGTIPSEITIRKKEQ